jgi:hypothetical protein
MRTAMGFAINRDDPSRTSLMTPIFEVQPRIGVSLSPRVQESSPAERTVSAAGSFLIFPI